MNKVELIQNLVVTIIFHCYTTLVMRKTNRISLFNAYQSFMRGKLLSINITPLNVKRLVTSVVYQQNIIATKLKQ